MRWLLFLSRLAFICNLLFLVSFLLRVTNGWYNPEFASYIILIGWVFSIIFNPAVNIMYLILFWVKKTSLAVVPLWLIVLNILFLMLQLIFLFLMNVE